MGIFSALLSIVKSKHKSKSYWLNCLHSFRAENERDSHKKNYVNHNFCEVVLPKKKKDKIIEYSLNSKSIKIIK